MATITCPCRASERVLIRQRFVDATDVAAGDFSLEDGATANRGLILPDNTTAHAYSEFTNNVFQRDSFTIKIRFRRTLPMADSTNRYWLDSDLGARIAIWKTATDLLETTIGATNVLISAYSTYSPYYDQFGVNTIHSSMVSGGTSAMYLNGTQIDTGVSSWSPFDTLWIRVGQRFTPVAGFSLSGTIYELSIYDGAWTQDDVTADLHPGKWRLSERSELWVDCSTETTGPTGLAITRDHSRHGRDPVLGDGAGAGQPTFGNPGYTFDGVDDYLGFVEAPSGSAYTVGYKQRGYRTAFESDLTTWTQLATGGGWTGTLEYLAWWPWTLSAIQQREVAARWEVG